jgi:hypothetical protein
MVTSFSKDKMVDVESEAPREEKIPSLLQRFKAKFQRAQVH